MENQKRILLISNMYPSKKNKYYGVFVQNTENLLKENGFLVDKVVLKKKTNILIKLICYIIFNLKVIFKGLFHKYDYMYIHFISHSSFGAVIVKRIKKRIKLVLNCHGNDVVPDTERDFKNIKRSKKYLKYADSVVVPSNYFKMVLKNDYRVKENKIFVYPSGGVNTSLFVKKDKEESKRKCHLNLKYNYIGYVSRIEQDKGWDTFLSFVKELDENNLIKKFNYRFLIVGSGIEKEKMLGIIKKLKLESFIDYREMVSQEELVYIYNSLELFVFPTYRRSDSLGLVGLEAMSCETFVIASDKYGPSDYMKDLKNGFTFECQNYKDLYNKVIKYQELTEKERKEIIKEGRTTAILYDIQNTKDKILEVFR